MIRKLSADDYEYVIARVNEWWGGRNVVDMLPRLFFDHFCNTSFVFVSDGRVVGFVVGFLSDAHVDVAYIHFTGVDPEYRKSGVASSLYKEFIEVARINNRKYVKCVTSPSNSHSLAYHQKMGFVPSKQDDNSIPLEIDDYDGEGNHRVLLTLSLIE